MELCPTSGQLEWGSQLSFTFSSPSSYRPLRFAGCTSSWSLPRSCPPLVWYRIHLPAMLLSPLWAFLFLPAFSSLVGAQGPLQTLFPAAIPLAVKTPYMNVWYDSGNKSGPLSQSWPLVWNLNSTASFFSSHGEEFICYNRGYRHQLSVGLARSESTGQPTTGWVSMTRLSPPIPPTSRLRPHVPSSLCGQGP